MGQFGVDVWPRSHDGKKAELLNESQKSDDVEMRILFAEVRLTDGDLVLAPRDVGVDEPHAESLGFEERVFPDVAMEPPIVHAPRVKRYDAPIDDDAAATET